MSNDSFYHWHDCCCCKRETPCWKDKCKRTGRIHCEECKEAERFFSPDKGQP